VKCKYKKTPHIYDKNNDTIFIGFETWQQRNFPILCSRYRLKKKASHKKDSFYLAGK